MRRCVALLVGAIALTASGCSEDGPSVEERNEPAVAELTEQVERAGDFTRLEVSYVDDASSAEELVLTVACEACDAVAVADRAVELAWRSEVEPLQSISVYVEDLADAKIETRALILRRDGAELEERYGERSVDSGSGNS